MGTRSTSRIETFDPARDGFGFRNPVGWVPNRTGRERILRRFDPFLYGKGLCFGMAAAALLYYFDARAADARSTDRPPLAELPPTPALLNTLRKYHARQYGPRSVFATVRDWIGARGGRSERVLGRLRLAGASPDPHVLCFGPALNRRFFSCLARAHAVVPCRVEEGRVYVYDPNYPGDRGRFVEFWRGGTEFAYGGFRSREGWGITLVSVRAVTPVLLSVDHDLRGRLGEIGGERRQVVIANAEYDYLTTTEEGRQTTEQIKGAEYTETKGIGHFPMSENHPVFKEYLQQVLQKIEERAGARE